MPTFRATLLAAGCHTSIDRIAKPQCSGTLFRKCLHSSTSSALFCLCIPVEIFPCWAIPPGCLHWQPDVESELPVGERSPNVDQLAEFAPLPASMWSSRAISISCRIQKVDIWQISLNTSRTQLLREFTRPIYLLGWSSPRRHWAGGSTPMQGCVVELEWGPALHKQTMMVGRGLLNFFCCNHPTPRIRIKIAPCSAGGGTAAGGPPITGKPQVFAWSAGWRLLPLTRRAPLAHDRFWSAPVIVANNDARYQINKDRPRSIPHGGPMPWTKHHPKHSKQKPVTRKLGHGALAKCYNAWSTRIVLEDRTSSVREFSSVLSPIAWMCAQVASIPRQDTGELPTTLPLAIGMPVAIAAVQVDGFVQGAYEACRLLLQKIRSEEDLAKWSKCVLMAGQCCPSAFMV